MDVLDLRILRALGFLPFEKGPRPLDATKPGQVARRLGLNPDLVKERIDRMEAQGLVAGYEVHVNLRHLGLRQVTYHFHLDAARKREVAKALEPVDGITAVFDYVGDEICVDLVHATSADLERKQRLLATLTGVEVPLRVYQNPDLPPQRALTRLDWRIVRALRGRARRPFPEVAEELGISAKTVKRRAERMAEEGSVDVLPIINPGRLTSFVPVALGVHISPDAEPDTLARVKAVLEHRLLYAFAPPSAELGQLEIALYATSTGEVEQLRHLAADVPGVARVDLALPCGARFMRDWLNEAIDARIREASLSESAP